MEIQFEVFYFAILLPNWVGGEIHGKLVKGIEASLAGLSEAKEKPHVLVVDDGTLERTLAKMLFTLAECQVITADSGLKALEILGLGEHKNINNQGPKIDLIITDYCMPEMTGYDLLKKIKESSDTKEIPVVVVSTDNHPERVEKCLKEGAREFIIKPLSLSDVKKLVLNIIPS